MAPDEKLISIKEACELLGISRPTFNKVRKNRNLTVIAVGKRARFIKQEILKILAAPERPTVPKPDPRVALTMTSKNTAADLETSPGVFDLTRILRFDPYGVLNLLCSLASLAASGKEIKLEVEDNFICNHLRSLGFFIELEKVHKGSILWDNSKMTTSHQEISYPIPLTHIHMQKQEAPVVDKLITLLRHQGFSESIGGYIGWIIGELVDNSMTHLVYNSAPADCYTLAQRFISQDFTTNSIMIGITDIGPGIHSTLKKNPKYSHLSDMQAFLSAFKPGVSSWEESYGRGKGLADVLAIAMGNQSALRVESGVNCFEIDFRGPPRKLSRLPREIPGTRFVLKLIDRDFEVKKGTEVSAFIDNLLGET